MIPLAAIVIALLERVPTLRVQPARLLRRYVATDVLHLLIGFVALGWLGAWYFTAAADHAAGLGAPRAAWAAVPFAAQAAAALLAIDLGNYLVHVLMHRSDVLWEFHKTHHSSRHLDWLAAFRSHVVEQLLRRALAPVLLVLAGVPVDAAVTAAGVFLVWAMFIHSNLRLPLGLLEPIFVTPQLHRVHHAPATAERNLGNVLTCWDRLLGTFVAAGPAADAPLGLPRERDTYPQTWGAQLVRPWRARAARPRRRGPARAAARAGLAPGSRVSR
jgi:sterol desaturase/sphingolipid hydroxylase (fatty acid hydroxylase superfamily)